MTLNDFVRFAAEHPTAVIIYFSLIPFAALLTRFMDREEAHLPPWNYLYTSLLYLVAVPAVLSVALAVYQWLFGDGNLLVEADPVLQILPVVSLIVTALLIRSQVDLQKLPGFGSLGGMIVMIGLALLVIGAAGWVGLAAVGELPIRYLLVIFLLLLILVRRVWPSSTASVA
ncbi:hypothetical protein GGR28_002361 [Lewinella aquimaris]|uniref:Uncharacterized protein n=1 Tax=Neolewinella aquimaris TaxID=1835722 RepID=A0A840EFN2_9BACT|nr:hypothetical protein [Neolewinella aquimaris]MBB4079736.1 hypothetical protein [Neolewinella aquimaris]